MQSTHKSQDVEPVVENHGTCMFVLAEGGEGEIGKALYKLGACWNDVGWLVPIEHKNTVEGLCAHLDFFEIPLPAPFETYKNSAQVGLLKFRIDVTEREIGRLADIENIKFIDINKLYDKNVFPNLTATTNGIKISELLYKRQSLQEKITLLQKKPIDRQESNLKEIKTLDKLIDSQDQRLAQFKGQEFIGIPQKTLPRLDEMLLGLRKYIMIAASPNIGKTALSIQIGIDAVLNNSDVCLLYVSLEMLREEIEDRIKSSLASMTYKKLYFGSMNGGDKGWYTNDEIARLNKSKALMGDIGKRVLILDEETSPNIDAEKILSHLLNLKNETGCTRAIIIIDYLGVFPIPEVLSGKFLSENDVDRYRATQMKKLRKALNNDPLIVIAEARKQPTGSEIWTVNSIADILGSSRNGYSIDAGILLNNLTDEELSAGISNPAALKTRKKTKTQDDQLNGADIRSTFNDHGITILKLKVDKARDGMQKGEFLLRYSFEENSFEQTTWFEVKNLYDTYQPETNNQHARRPEVNKSQKERNPFDEMAEQ